MGDPRFLGTEQRKRMGAESSHLGMTVPNRRSGMMVPTHALEAGDQIVGLGLRVTGRPAWQGGDAMGGPESHFYRVPLEDVDTGRRFDRTYNGDHRHPLV